MTFSSSPPPASDDAEPRLVSITAALLVAAAVAMVVPFVMTTYLGDDIFDSVVNGVSLYNGESVAHLILAVNRSVMLSDGRLQMPALFQYLGIFALIQNLLVYKALQVLAVVVNLGTLYVLLRTLKIPALSSLLIVAVALATLQIRVYHDPILGFSLLYETMLEFNLLSFALFARFCSTRRTVELAASVLFFFLAVAYYETSYPLSAVHVLIAVRMTGWSGWRRATPFLGLSVLFGALSLTVRHFVHMRPDATYRLGLDPLVYLVTLVKQVFAAVPLSYLAFFGPRIFGTWSHLFDAAPWFVVLPLGIIAFAALAVPLLNGRRTLSARVGFGGVAAIGGTLWVLSAALVALLPRYQEELQFGLGYLPVYFEDFGAALVFGSALLALLSAAARRANRRQWTALSVSVALMFSLVLSATYSANAWVINTYAVEDYGRAALTSALETGMLGRLHDGDTLFVNSASESVRRFQDFTHPKYFLREEAGVKLNVFPLDSVGDHISCDQNVCPARNGRTFVMVSKALDARSSYAIVGRIAGAMRVALGGAPLVTPGLANAELFLRGPELGELSGNRAFSVAWQEAGCGMPGFRARSVPLDQLVTVRSGTEWRVVRVPPSCGMIPVASLGVFSRP